MDKTQLNKINQKQDDIKSSIDGLKPEINRLNKKWFRNISIWIAVISLAFVLRSNYLTRKSIDRSIENDKPRLILKIESDQDYAEYSSSRGKNITVLFEINATIENIGVRTADSTCCSLYLLNPCNIGEYQVYHKKNLQQIFKGMENELKFIIKTPFKEDLELHALFKTTYWDSETGKKIEEKFLKIYSFKDMGYTFEKIGSHLELIEAIQKIENYKEIKIDCPECDDKLYDGSVA